MKGSSNEVDETGWNKTFEGTKILYSMAGFGSRDLFEKVLSELDELAEMGTATRDMWNMRFDCLIALGRWDELLDLSTDLQKEYGMDDKELWRVRAIAHKGARRRRKCIKTLDLALERFPRDPELKDLRESMGRD